MLYYLTGVLLTYIYIEMRTKNRPVGEVVCSSIVFPLFWFIFFRLYFIQAKKAYDKVKRQERRKKWLKDNGYKDEE